MLFFVQKENTQVPKILDEMKYLTKHDSSIYIPWGHLSLKSIKTVFC